VEDLDLCGVCDNCLQKKKSAATQKELQLFIETIFSKIKDNGGLKMQEIPLFKEPDKTQKAINFLLSEEKIYLKGDQILLK
jgi:hypothetical protein